jgi:hypothetical protein
MAKPKSSGFGYGLFVLWFGWGYLMYVLTGLSHTCNSTLACGSKYNPATVHQDAVFAAFAVIGPIALAGLIVAANKRKNNVK